MFSYLSIVQAGNIFLLYITFVVFVPCMCLCHLELSWFLFPVYLCVNCNSTFVVFVYPCVNCNSTFVVFVSSLCMSGILIQFYYIVSWFVYFPALFLSVPDRDRPCMCI